MESMRKSQIIALLKGIETGDPSSVEVINPDKYIQHNPQTFEGREGLAALFKRLSLTNPRVNIVRIFEDGDFVFAHTEYDFAQSNIGFEVFRFEGDITVEHWDNIQPRMGPNTSGHSMIGGPLEMSDLASTEENRQLVRSFVDEILINAEISRLDQYITDQHFTQHNPLMTDGKSAIVDALGNSSDEGFSLQYRKNYRVLAEGSFVLAVSEGHVNQVHSAIYDLYRVDGGRIVEHWDTIEAIPPRNEWKNENGKF
jgi:predicted SnoaL-like aldol condensation-catalyzing enzyme